MLRWLNRLVLSALLIVGCGDGERLVLKVSFPDDAARDQAKRLWVAAIGPGEGYGCDELKQGQAVPGDAGYSIESEVSFDWPATGEIRGLGDVTAGRKLFYAAAEDENGEVLLRGCTEAQVGEKESREVTIALEWVSKSCGIDGDCEDSNDCTTDRCSQEKCVNEPVADGTECGARTCGGLAWMMPTCQSGACTGSEPVADCEDGNDCTQDGCDDLDGCVSLPLMAGTDCGVCAACDGQGVCIDDLTEDLDCALCQECRPAGTCMYQAAGSDVKGECTDEIFCDGVETCDGAGGCQAGGDPCPGLNCIEDSDTCEGCLADAACPSCQVCDAGDCVNQPQGSDSKDDCAADACNTGTCDGAGACGLEAMGTDCGVCAACDGLGMCVRDLTQDQDCPVCQECEAAGSCVNQSAGTACDDGDPCSTLDACDGAGACVSGATDKDSDGDGYYDDRCPGGDDCDDDVLAVNPGAVEGPVGDPTCSDGADNNCNGQTDGQDSSCSSQQGYRKLITIDFNRVGGASDLPDFPVLVSIQNDSDLRTTANGGNVVNGYDITFRASDGTTQLDHEVEKYDPASGTLDAWVRVPSLSASADTIIYVDYGHPGIDAPTENPAGVWDGNFIFVAHLHDDLEDSTSNGNNCTNQGASVIGGKIADGRDFEDTEDDLLDCGNDASLDLTERVTISAWIKPESNSSYGDSVCKDNLYTLQFTNATLRPRLAVKRAGVSGWMGVNSPDPIDTADFYYIVGVYDVNGGANNMRLYVNGQMKAQGTFIDNIEISTGPLTLGWYASGTHEYDGIIDEARISSNVRSAGWIETEYNNQNSPSTFYNIGAEEPSPL